MRNRDLARLALAMAASGVMAACGGGDVAGGGLGIMPEAPPNDPSSDPTSARIHTLVASFCENERACFPQEFAAEYGSLSRCVEDGTDAVDVEFSDFEGYCLDAALDLYECFVEMLGCGDAEDLDQASEFSGCELEVSDAQAACGGG
ncbi:MAG: hypothetical protein JW751_06990 [Polyangiaceae bacterium]|nr:hypothetical protein [Polyangiaceae bacterium]